MKKLVAAGLLLIAGTHVCRCADMNKMDHGPFASWTVLTEPITHKGIVIKADSAAPAAICFDTDLLRVSAAWTGGLLKWYPQRDGLEKNPTPDGLIHFGNDSGPGWSRTRSFADPRSLPYGPLPRNSARYQGLYLHQDKVLLSYTVGECAVLELPGFKMFRSHPAFSRTFNLSNTPDALSLRIFQLPEGGAALERTTLAGAKGYVQVRAGQQWRLIGFDGIPSGAEWRISDRHLCLELPLLKEPLRFKVVLGPALNGAANELISDFAADLQAAPLLPDLSELRKPGPARWLPELKTQAVAGAEEGPFAIDLLTIPEANPWNSWIRLTGLDFLSDGRAIVTSVSGDVWLVSGIGETLGALTWRRFATGLYEPLGIKAVEDQIYVLGRDQITRLHDLNRNGEADYYENFNNETMVAENFHEYTMNLETDSKGDFYFAKGAPWPPNVKTPHAGVLFKLSKDGSRLETFATGLRGPNGLTVGPRDEITFSDNEGHWVPTCCLHLAKKGGFFGMKPTAHMPEVPKQFEQPICWIPHAVDNSPGGQIWVTSDKWGPLKDSLLLTSYGKSTLSLVLMETVEGQAQGGILNLPLRFQSGLIRGRFHKDGHLYLCGLRVWQSTGTKYGAFHRVRYTGKPLYLPLALHVRPGGVELSFSCALDPAHAADEQNYSIEQWNYRWIERYGSPAYSVKNPEQEGRDTVAIRSLRLSEDRKSVFLQITDLKPVMQMRIAYNLLAADGTPLRHDIYNTINRVPAGR
jgi:glucose/arabinose dehydrogenase